MDGVHHLGNTRLGDAISGTAEFCFETPLRDHIETEFFGKQFLRFANSARLIDEGKTSPQVVFPKMRQQDIRFAAPGFEQARYCGKTWITGLSE